MRKLGWIPMVLALALAVVSVAAGPHDKAKAGAEAKQVTVQGEVLDMACFLGHGAKGPAHAECALKCLKGGQPMGLLGKDGTVYLLLADHQDPSSFNAAKELAGKNVEIRGESASSGSIKGITVQSVKAI